jgi:PAS domain S-box-containing protein
MTIRWRSFTNSLRFKITLLACAASLATALVMSGFAYFRTSETSLNTAIEDLAGARRRAALQFRDTFRSMQDDTYTLARSPPVSGIMRSAAHGGIDPEADLTTEQWKQRLATQFTALLRSHPTYSQVRLIGLADSGRELVRVNRAGRGFETVPGADLQQKSGEPYFQHGAALAPDGVYFSPITYNRENNHIDAALAPTVRSVVPVYNDHGVIFGMIVINVDYGALLAGPFLTVELNGQSFIVNQTDSEREYLTESVAAQPDLNLLPAPGLQLSPAESGSEAVFLEAGIGGDFINLPVNTGATQSPLGAVLSLPRDELMRTVIATQRQSIILAAFLILLSCITTAVVANRLTRPMRRMAQDIANAQDPRHPLHLPVGAGDEIGELARAFQTMTEGLQKNEVKTRAIINSVVDGLIVIDEFGIVDSYNPACQRIFGYDAGEVLGQNIKMLMPSPYHEEHDQYLHAYQRTKTRKIIGIGREVAGRRKDGSTFPMDLSVSEIMLNDRPHYCGMVRDISARKQMDIMKDEFISTVNHELRTPLTSIYGALGLLKIKAAGRLDAKSNQLLELAHNSCQRLTVLVNDILDLEKIAAGKVEYRFEIIDICELVSSIVTQNASLAESRSITLETHFEIGDVAVRLDTGRFHQALINLLSNALRYSPQNDVVTISVAKRGSGQVRISVADNGPGIPESFQDKVFDRFAQADSSLTRQEGSSGLGLNITQTLIQAFGGEVSFETEEGRGTVFHFDLPICTLEQDAA